MAEFTKKEKIVLFNQIRDIRKALERIKPGCMPLRFNGSKELEDVIENLEKVKKRKARITKTRSSKIGG